MSTTDGMVEFYIASFDFFATNGQGWSIYNDTRSNCLAIYDKPNDAIKRAITMAEYSVACGRGAQIHVQQADHSWKTVWFSLNTKPRFP